MKYRLVYCRIESIFSFEGGLELFKISTDDKADLAGPGLCSYQSKGDSFMLLRRTLLAHNLHVQEAWNDGAAVSALDYFVRQVRKVVARFLG
jgi:hypothetical protein